jgi:hypothetical protein
MKRRHGPESKHATKRKKEKKRVYMYLRDGKAISSTHLLANPGEGHKAAHMNTVTCKPAAAIKQPKKEQRKYLHSFRLPFAKGERLMQQKTFMKIGGIHEQHREHTACHSEDQVWYLPQTAKNSQTQGLEGMIIGLRL